MNSLPRVALDLNAVPANQMTTGNRRQLRRSATDQQLNASTHWRLGQVVENSTVIDIATRNTVAVFAVLPRDGIEIHGSTAVMGLELTVFPR